MVVGATNMRARTCSLASTLLPLRYCGSLLKGRCL
nr:MAG TPA: hypothetical protein [Caudoviricetes sp.]